MNAAKANKLRLFKPRDEPEHIPLGTPFQAGLETDKVEMLACYGVLTQLDDRMGPPPGPRIVQPHGFHGAVAQGLAPAIRHDLDGKAGLEIGCVHVMKRHALCGQQGIQEALVLVLVERTVDEIRTPLVVASGHPGDFHVDGVAFDDGRDGVVEVQAATTSDGREPVCKGVGSEGARGQNGWSRQIRNGDLGFSPRDVRMAFQRCRHCVGKDLAIHRQAVACGDPGGFRATQDQGIHAPHLGFQDPSGGGWVIALEGVRADHLRGMPGGVGGGAPLRAHFRDADRVAPRSQLPGGFRPSQPRSDDVNHAASCRGSSYSGHVLKVAHWLDPGVSETASANFLLR